MDFITMNFMFPRKHNFMFQERETHPSEWDNVLANYMSDKGLITRIYKGLFKQ